MVAKFDWLRGVTNQITEGVHISHSLLKNADILDDRLTASRETSRMFYALPNIYKATDFNERVSYSSINFANHSVVDHTVLSFVPRPIISVLGYLNRIVESNVL